MKKAKWFNLLIDVRTVCATVSAVVSYIVTNFNK